MGNKIGKKKDGTAASSSQAGGLGRSGSSGLGSSSSSTNNNNVYKGAKASGVKKTSRKSSGSSGAKNFDDITDPYEKFSQLFAEDLKTSHLGPSTTKSTSWKTEDGKTGSGGSSKRSSSRVEQGDSGAVKGPYESTFREDDPRFNSAFSNIVLCPTCKTPNRVPYASKFKCYNCGALVDPGTFNSRAHDEEGYYNEAILECDVGLAVMEQKRKEIADDIERERVIQVTLAKSGLGENNWRAEELFKDLQACRYTIIQLEKQKGAKLFDISEKLVDLINLYDHAEDMLLNWSMLKDAIQKDDRVNMEIFLSELDPAFSGKSKRYIVWLMEKEKEILNNLAFDSLLQQALKDDDEDLLLDLIEEVKEFDLNYDIEFLTQQVRYIKEKKKRAHLEKTTTRMPKGYENSFGGGATASSSKENQGGSATGTSGGSKRTFFSAGGGEDETGPAKPKATSQGPKFRNMFGGAPSSSATGGGTGAGGGASGSSTSGAGTSGASSSTSGAGTATGKAASSSSSTNANASNRASSASSTSAKASSSASSPPTGKAASAGPTQAPGSRHPGVPADLNLEEPVFSKKQACTLLGLDFTDKKLDAAAYKKAYRKKALEWHPDRQQNHEYVEDATRMFQKIKEALDYLQNLETKKQASMAAGRAAAAKAR
ncbi:unnamed protein product [Amoebophrya sp. A25]|nr:unnamed protein product [Amoebophrya sp. A25]|eukprot:GSA25T00012848001.1